MTEAEHRKKRHSSHFTETSCEDSRLYKCANVSCVKWQVKESAVVEKWDFSQLNHHWALMKNWTNWIIWANSSEAAVKTTRCHRKLQWRFTVVVQLTFAFQVHHGLRTPVDVQLRAERPQQFASVTVTGKWWPDEQLLTFTLFCAWLHSSNRERRREHVHTAEAFIFWNKQTVEMRNRQNLVNHFSTSEILFQL